MAAADPSYPLYPIACLLASIMLLLVLTTGLVRQSWNLGVTFLCFWLFFENLSYVVDAFVWSDNADLKLYVYCDIASRIQMVSYITKPMATLMITRRLYLIASLQSVELSSKAARRWDLAVEWTLGFVIPLLVAGPIYYVNQGSRFLVLEGFGCTNAPVTSILEYLTDESWTILAPLVSIIFYYPKVARMYYRQRRDADSFLSSNSSVSRTSYLRIFILASIDILLTLPVGIVTLTLDITAALSPGFPFSFYPGWTFVHSNWEPVGIPYADIQADGTVQLALIYFSQWTSPVLAFAIFGLFGVTSEARTSYWRIVCTVGGWFGWKPTPRGRNGRGSLGEIEFGARPQDISAFDVEMGSRPVSFVHIDTPATEETAKYVSGSESESGSDVIKGVCQNSSEVYSEDVERLSSDPEHSSDTPARSSIVDFVLMGTGQEIVGRRAMGKLELSSTGSEGTGKSP
ncbi:STE3-domain-containing protein [Peniophora sp. CONT]|nr:STE3-domain-containing protein [Peniophora sp. CONT]